MKLEPAILVFTLLFTLSWSAASTADPGTACAVKLIDCSDVYHSSYNVAYVATGIGKSSDQTVVQGVGGLAVGGDAFCESIEVHCPDTGFASGYFADISLKKGQQGFMGRAVWTEGAGPAVLTDGWGHGSRGF